MDWSSLSRAFFQSFQWAPFLACRDDFGSAELEFFAARFKYVGRRQMRRPSSSGG
jgi:hypothetical protein